MTEARHGVRCRIRARRRRHLTDVLRTVPESSGQVQSRPESGLVYLAVCITCAILCGQRISSGLVCGPCMPCMRQTLAEMDTLCAKTLASKQLSRVPNSLAGERGFQTHSPALEQTLAVMNNRCVGELVFKAYRFVCHSNLGSRVIKKRRSTQSLNTNVWSRRWP